MADDQNIYFDTSNVRGFAEYVTHLLSTKYRDRADEIRALLSAEDPEGADGRARDGDTAATMGSSGVEYYGLDVAKSQSENASNASFWLAGFVHSLEDIATAGAVAAEDFTGADGDNADGMRDGFETPAYEHA